jgi:hypothetical protein
MSGNTHRFKRLAIMARLGGMVMVWSCLWGASTAVAAGSEQFGLESATAEESTGAAGMHPDFTTRIVFNHKEVEGGRLESSGRTEDVSVALPPGLIGNPTNFPQCSTGQFLAEECPIATQVGIIEVLLSELPESEVLLEPVYNIQPPNREMVARLGFVAAFYVQFIDVTVRTGSDYGVTATVHSASGQRPIISATTTLWGNPADPVHNELRLTPFEAEIGCKTTCLPPGPRSSGLPVQPFMTNPTACEEQQIKVSATSYQFPGQVFGADSSMPPTTKCSQLAFQPSLTLEPTTHQAGAPTGLSAVLRMPQTNSVNLPATSAMKDAVVTLPEGMTIATGAGNGLEACSAAQVGFGGEGQSSCPEASKIGTATFVSPDLPEPIHGAIYLRTPEPGNLFRIWLVTDEFGLHLKIPGEIKANAQTGRLTTIFENTPQLPVEEIDLELKGGPRAPLKNPNKCGNYSSQFELTPWSGGSALTAQSSMTIDEGCNAGGFKPQFSAGTENPVARTYSPLTVDLTQGSAEQNLSGLEVKLPPGVLARLGGVELCPEAQTATGNCPAGSQIGTTSVATGPGSSPLWIPQPGKAPTAVYLAGPYRGAPYSLVIKTPAQAGPFDLGTVIVRASINVDPTTTQATVTSDPLPQILEGVPIAYRTIHVSIDRPDFALNPTNCEPTAFNAAATSNTGTVAGLSSRFQAGECAALAFKPNLQLSLKGSTKHAGHPGLKAVLTYPKQGAYANIARAQVNLPHSEFLDQGNLNKVCTKPVLIAGNCPKSSVYGRAKAWTPLLNRPLEGNVYLVGGYGYKLPALVADLNGQIRVLLVGKVDSGPNNGIRNTFEAVPDAPVEKFELQLKGGKKYSLLENSEDLCQKTQRANARFTGQNGAVDQTKPLIANGCKKSKGIAG